MLGLAAVPALIQVQNNSSFSLNHDNMMLSGWILINVVNESSKIFFLFSLYLYMILIILF